MTVSLEEQKVLNLWSLIYQFFYIDNLFGAIPKNTWPNPRSQGFSLCFSFRPMIHFVLIFMYGMNFISRFISFPIDDQLVQHTLVEISSLHWTVVTFLSKIKWLCLCESVSGLSILFYWSICLYLLFGFPLTKTRQICHVSWAKRVGEKAVPCVPKNCE